MTLIASVTVQESRILIVDKRYIEINLILLERML